jgi:uncharacterized glyoxalase superfamily protein PhnB
MTAQAPAASSIIPTLRYRDALSMIDWLCRAFAFERHAVYADGDQVHHAQLTYGSGMIMLGSVQPGDSWGQFSAHPAEIGGRTTHGCCVIVADADAHQARAVAAGAEVVMAIADQDYGGRGYACRDPEGYVWWFGTYNPWAA